MILIVFLSNRTSIRNSLGAAINVPSSHKKTKAAVTKANCFYFYYSTPLIDLCGLVSVLHQYKDHFNHMLSAYKRKPSIRLSFLPLLLLTTTEVL